MSSTSWRLCEAILFCESEGQAVRKSEGLAREYGDRHGNPVIQCMVAYTGRGGASLCTIIWQTESQQSYPGLHSKFKKTARAKALSGNKTQNPPNNNNKKPVIAGAGLLSERWGLKNSGPVSAH